jgi:hypothetical protein
MRFIELVSRENVPEVSKAENYGPVADIVIADEARTNDRYNSNAKRQMNAIERTLKDNRFSMDRAMNPRFEFDNGRHSWVWMTLCRLFTPVSLTSVTRAA